MGPGAFHRCHERDRTGEGAEALIGKYQHNIDAKGRLFIPAKFREQLGDVFYVTIGLDGCLSVYSDSKWEQLLEKYDTLSLAQARKVRVLFANAAECQPDSQGRILIPANRCDTLVVGVSAPIGTLVEQAAAAVLDGCRN